MGRSTGFEPATSGTTNRRSNQLSYDRHPHVPGNATPVRRQGPTRVRAFAQQPRLEKRKLRGPGLQTIFFCPRLAYRPAMMTPGESSAQTLLARPGMQRVPSPKLELFMLRGFLDEAECDALIARIEANRRPSTLANFNGDDSFRTSETCDLDVADPAVVALDGKLAALSGIDPTHGETMQGQRYDVGQEFKAHTDCFEPNSDDWTKYCSVAGQRTWTFMIYLNTVPAGGATRFKAIDKIVQPERGKLLAWNNRNPDGSVNMASMHHGMKVRRGCKYIITRWYRERPWG
jgi:prolyl 4-hydroxylase